MVCLEPWLITYLYSDFSLYLQIYVFCIFDDLFLCLDQWEFLLHRFISHNDVARMDLLFYAYPEFFLILLYCFQAGCYP